MLVDICPLKCVHLHVQQHVDSVVCKLIFGITIYTLELLWQYNQTLLSFPYKSVLVESLNVCLKCVLATVIYFKCNSTRMTSFKKNVSIKAETQ